MSLELVVGTTYGPVTIGISAEKVSEYVEATGDSHERWQDYAPPGYAGALLFVVAPHFLADPRVEPFTGVLVHVDQTFTWHGPLAIGAEVMVTGTVERVNMRVTMLRDLEGRVHFIPNGQIGSLTNRTYDWARALVEIPVGPEQDVDRVMVLLVDVARDLAADPEWADEIVDEPSSSCSRPSPSRCSRSAASSSVASRRPSTRPASSPASPSAWCASAPAPRAEAGSQPPAQSF